MMAKGFFITGTDTGVGKTIITAALVKLAQHFGYRATGMKPVETGCQRAVDSRQQTADRAICLTPSDGKFLREMSGTDESLQLLTPVRFETPLAPMPASEREGVEADVDKIISAFRALTQKYDVLIVEGVGGILVPIRKDYSVMDMAKTFGLPVIVVARPGLGTINHTLLTVHYALRGGITVAGVIINYAYPPEETIAEQTNPLILKEICPVPILGIFPYLEKLQADTIEKAALTNLELEIIRKYIWRE